MSAISAACLLLTARPACVAGRGGFCHRIGQQSTTAERARVDYCLAELYAQAGMKEEAIKYLRKALDAGFDDNKRLMQDQEFASIRQTAEFEQLVAAAKRP